MTFSEILNHRWIRVAAVLCAILLAYVWCRFGLASAEMASWVQAIGSVAAIGLGVWTFVSQQAERKKEAISDAKQARKILLQAIQAEVETSWEQFFQGFEQYLYRPVDPKTPVNVLHHVEDTPFPVYVGVVGQIGLIESPDLRRRIIGTYSLARGMISMMQINNSFLERVEELGRLVSASQPSQSDNEQVTYLQPGRPQARPAHVSVYLSYLKQFNLEIERLGQHGDATRETAAHLKSEVEVLIPMLKDAIEEA